MQNCIVAEQTEYSGGSDGDVRGKPVCRLGHSKFSLSPLPKKPRKRIGAPSTEEVVGELGGWWRLLQCRRKHGTVAGM